jgi:hypothetical protein
MPRCCVTSVISEGFENMKTNRSMMINEISRKTIRIQPRSTECVFISLLTGYEALIVFSICIKVEPSIGSPGCGGPLACRCGALALR